MVRAMCEVQLKDRKMSMDLMFILGLNETIDQLAMANSVRWHGHVLRRKDGHVLRRALDFEVEGLRKKGKPKRTWKKQVEEESVKVGLRMEGALCRLIIIIIIIIIIIKCLKSYDIIAALNHS